ncbi:MAG: hypothetical protein ACREBJ_08225 [Nitrosotalea sp.]
METIDHPNKGLFDVYTCLGCQPTHETWYRQVFYAGEYELLATTIRVDEYYIVVNYSFNYSSKRTRYTTIYKKILGTIDNSMDFEPLTWGPDLPFADLNFVIDLRLHDIPALKRKLSIYTTSS